MGVPLPVSVSSGWTSCFWSQNRNSTGSWEPLGLPVAKPWGPGGGLCVEELGLERWDAVMGPLAGLGQERGQGSRPNVGRKEPPERPQAGDHPGSGQCLECHLVPCGALSFSFTALGEKPCIYVQGSVSWLVPWALRVKEGLLKEALRLGGEAGPPEGRGMETQVWCSALGLP